MEKIWGIYLNNLHYKQIESIYAETFPDGSSRQKVDRINDLLELDELPDHQFIRDYLFGGRVSVLWIRLPDVINNSVESIREKLSAPPLSCYERPQEPYLDHELHIVHGFSHNGRTYITLGIGEFRSQFTINEYTLRRNHSEYFAIVSLFEADGRFLEIHCDNRLVLRVIKTLREHIDLDIRPNALVPEISMGSFLEFKGLLAGSRLRKYKGRSVDDSEITEIFEYTARRNVDYANENAFQEMIEELEDEALSLVFSYNGEDYTIRLGLVTGSVYFQSFTPECAINYVFEAFRETFLEQ